MIQVVNPLSPVIQSPDFIKHFCITEFFFEIIKITQIDILSRSPRRSGFIIDLISDNCGVIFEMVDNLPDHPLSVIEICGVGNIGVLPDPVRRPGRFADLFHLHFRMVVP